MIGNKQMGTNHLDQQNHGPCKEIQVMKHGKCGNDRAFLTNGKLRQRLGAWEQLNFECIFYACYQSSTKMLWYFI
jgi:hypothetical protein